MSPAAAGNTKLKIFLVEDNDDTRLLLAYLLQDAGYEVQAASTVEAALQAFSSSGSGILLSDVGLPDGSGWDLLAALRMSGASPYAIAMSGFGTPSDVRASLAAGFRHHLVKPVHLDDLERLLGEARSEIERTA